MTAVNRKAPSLLTRTMMAMVAVIVLVLLLHGVYVYSTQRAAVIDAMTDDVDESLLRLGKNIAPFMEAYAINEYEKLVATEIALKEHYAVVVQDYEMGEILGIPVYVSGQIRTDAGGYVPYEHENPALNERLEQAFYSDTVPISGSDGEVLGQLSVYASDAPLIQKIRHVLLEELVITIVLALTLSLLLVGVLWRYFVRSVKHIESAIRNCDQGGVPLEPLPEFPYREVQVLSHTINTMLESIKESQDKLSLAAGVFKYAREGIILTSADGVILDVNSAFCTLTGYSRSEVIRQKYRFLASDRHNQKFYNAVRASLYEEGVWVGECWMPCQDGSAFPSLMTIAAVRNDAGDVQHYVTLIADISSLKENEHKLRQIAHYDSLTGLPNRMLLTEQLRRAVATARRRSEVLAVAFLDLDGFKEVNDTLGHAAGDELLKILAGRMKETIRECDIVARLGGDEFIILLPDLSGREGCDPALVRLINALSTPVSLAGDTVQVSASIGVSLYPQNPDVDADILIRQADMAMYRAKQRGKNQYRFFGGGGFEAFTAQQVAPASDRNSGRRAD